MELNLKQNQLGVLKGDLLKLEIDPKSHSAWTGGKQKLMDKGRISKFNKKFQNFKSDKKN
jgi:large subunit ribosomal protein L31